MSHEDNQKAQSLPATLDLPQEHSPQPMDFVYDYCQRNALPIEAGCSQVEQECARRADKARREYKALRRESDEALLADTRSPQQVAHNRDDRGTVITPSNQAMERNRLSASDKYNIRLRNNRKSAHASKVYQEILKREISRYLCSSTTETCATVGYSGTGVVTGGIDEPICREGRLVSLIQQLRNDICRDKRLRVDKRPCGDSLKFALERLSNELNEYRLGHCGMMNTTEEQSVGSNSIQEMADPKDRVTKKPGEQEAPGPPSTLPQLAGVERLIGDCIQSAGLSERASNGNSPSHTQTLDSSPGLYAGASGLRKANSGLTIVIPTSESATPFPTSFIETVQNITPATRTVGIAEVTAGSDGLLECAGVVGEYHHLCAVTAAPHERDHAVAPICDTPAAENTAVTGNNFESSVASGSDVPPHHENVHLEDNS